MSKPNSVVAVYRTHTEADQDMALKSQSAKTQTVQVIEADVLTTMNETNSLIAQRAFEIFQFRGGKHGSDQDDWFGAEEEVLPPLLVERSLSENALQLTAQVPGMLPQAD